MSSPVICKHMDDAMFHLRQAEMALERAQETTRSRREHDTAQQVSGVCRRARYAIHKSTRGTKR